MGFLSKNAPTNGTNGTPVAQATTTSTAGTTAPPAAKGQAAGGTGFLSRVGATPTKPTEVERQAKLDADFGSAEVPTGVVPEDAPSRMTTLPQNDVQEVSADAAPAKKRGRPKKVESADVDLPYDTNGEMSTAAPHTGAAKSKTKSFVLYIDVMMTKGAGGVDPVTLEDFFGPIDMTLNEWASEEKSLPSWWLTQFGEQKAMLAIKVQEQIAKGLPPAMLVRSSSSLARDLLPMLVPHATQIFNALRG